MRCMLPPFVICADHSTFLVDGCHVSVSRSTSAMARVEGHAEDARHDDRRPRLLEGEDPGRAPDEDPERVLRAAEVVADDGADHREHACDLQCREDVGQRVRDPHPPEDLAFARRVRPHELDLLRPHRRQASQRVHHHREEAEDRPRWRPSTRAQRAEPRVRDRGERDDRDGVRRDRVRHERVAERSPAGEHERESEGERAADEEAAERLLEREPAGAPHASYRSSQSVDMTSEKRGRKKSWTPKAGDDPLPGPTRMNAEARGRAAATFGRCRCDVIRPPLRACSASRTAVTSSKKCVSSRVSPPRGCGRSTSITSTIRPGRADMTTTRVERKTASAIECVTKTIVDWVSCQMRSSSMFSRSRVISSSAPNGSSISSSAGEKESARAIDTRCCMPPESCHGWCLSKPVSSTSSSISVTRSARRPRSQPIISSGREMFFATVRQS